MYEPEKTKVLDHWRGEVLSEFENINIFVWVSNPDRFAVIAGRFFLSSPEFKQLPFLTLVVARTLIICMPDIVLVQPPIEDFFLTAKRTIPYGLASIAANLEAQGFVVSIIDGLATNKSKVIAWPAEMAYLEPHYGRPDASPFALFHNYRHFGYSFDHLGMLVRQSGAFLVGISALFTPYYESALQTAVVIKKYHPDCRIGGWWSPCYGHAGEGYGVCCRRLCYSGRR